MLNLPSSQVGFSLIELMLSLLIGSATMLAATSMVAGVSSANRLGTYRLLLNDTGEQVLALVKRELGRAGYRNIRLNSNAQDFANSIQIGAYPGEQSQSCVLFRYDLNNNGQLDTAPQQEQFGFRLRDHAIEMRQNGAQCNANGWQDLTNAQHHRVTNFSVTDSNHQTAMSIVVRLEIASRKEPQLTWAKSIQLSIPNGQK